MGVDGRLNFDTKIDTKGFVNGTKTISSSLDGVKAMLGKIAIAAGAAFSVKQVINFGKATVSTANQTKNAWQGLESIMSGQGRSYAQATKWIQSYVSDGLIPLQNAVTAYKNLAVRGYDDSQIQSVLTALKDSAAYGRQASYSMGEAVQTATEGLKNENSILVDNAGVTKNVAKMWEDYAKSIGTSSSKLTQAQKIQAEVNGIMTETRFQTGDAAKVANSFSGQLSRLSFNFNELKVAVGGMLTTVLQPIVTYLNAALVKITAFAKAVSQAFGITNNITSSTSALTDSTSEAANNYADMAESAEKAQEANENSLASFDKITKLDNSSNSTNSSAGNSNANVKTQSVQAPNIKIPNWIKQIKDYINSGDWKSIGKMLAEKLNGVFDSINWDEIKNKLNKAMQNLAEFLNEFVDNLNWEQLGKTIGEGINTAFSGLYTFITTFDWGALGKSVADALNGMIDAIDWDLIGRTLSNKWNALIDFFYDFVTTFDWKLFGQSIATAVNGWFDEIDWAKAGTTLSEGIQGLLNSLIAFISEVDWGQIGEDIGEFVTSIDWFGIAEKIFDVIVEALRGASELLWEFIKEIVDGISEWFDGLSPQMKAVTTTVLAFFAAWKGTEILEFIYNAGGMVGVLNKIKNAIAGVTIAKIKDKAETIALLGMGIAEKIKTIATPIIEQIKLWGKLTAAKIKDKLESIKMIALYVKDFAVAIAGSVKNLALEAAAWARSTAAKIANKIAQIAMTAATVAWNTVCTIATAVTTAFGAAVSFLTSPIGLVILAIVALIAIGVLLYKNWDTVKEYALAAWEKIKEVFSAIGSWIYENVIEPVVNAFKTAWEAIKKVWSAVIGFFKRVWSGICNVFCSVKDWFAGIFSSAWNGIKNIFSKVGEFFGDVWSAIKKPFVAVVDWFKNIFQKAWEGVKNVFSKGGKVFEGIKEGISSVFFTVVNGLIDGINWVIAKPFQAINTAIGWIKDLSIAGWQPFSGLSELNIPQIPHLATGTVVPANYGEFLAVLGDNKHETEVVSPLSTMKQAMKEAIAEMGGGFGGNGDVVLPINLNIDGRKVHKEIARINKQEIRKTGNNPLVPVRT